MAWTKFVDMELDDEDSMDTVCPIPCDKPKWPYGLRICLTHTELAKLKLEPDCEVGDMIDLRCFGEVTSISISDGEGGKQCRVEIQFQKIALEDESNEDE